jgi:hypothetical protein
MIRPNIRFGTFWTENSAEHLYSVDAKFGASLVYIKLYVWFYLLKLCLLSIILISFLQIPSLALFIISYDVKAWKRLLKSDKAALCIVYIRFLWFCMLIFLIAIKYYYLYLFTRRLGVGILLWFFFTSTFLGYWSKKLMARAKSTSLSVSMCTWNRRSNKLNK